MKQLLLSLFTLYVCATSIAQDTVVVPVYILDSIPVPERLECGPEFSPDNFRLPEAVGSTLQDDIFGLRIGRLVSEQEVGNLFNERYNAQVDIPSRKVSTVYRVKNIPYLGFDWNVFLYVDKDDSTLNMVELNLLVPVNFDFASTNEDSINIIFVKLDETLDSQYGEPTRNLEGTVWHGPNDVDIVLSNDRSVRTYIPDPRREGLTTEAMIIQVLYLKKNE